MTKSNFYNKRVLLVATEFPPGPGGIGSHAYSLAKALSKKGFDVVVAANGDYAQEEAIGAFDRKQSFRVVRFKKGGIFSYLQRFSTVKRCIVEGRISTVLVSGKFALWIGLWLRLFAKGVSITGILHGSEGFSKCIGQYIVNGETVFLIDPILMDSLKGAICYCLSSSNSSHLKRISSEVYQVAGRFTYEYYNCSIVSKILDSYS